MREHSDNGYQVVMARCHYVMDSPAQTEWQVAGRFGDRYHGF